MGGAFRLEPELDRLLADHEVNRVVVDLAGVEFVDSAGLGALLASHERAKDAGIEMKLANPSDPVRRILDITGTADVLHD
jgi:anti-anti-sigma factor